MTEEPLKPRSLGDPAGQEGKPESSSSSSKRFWIASLILLMGGFGVIGWLSRQQTPLSPPVPVATATPEAPPTPTPDPGAKLAAEQALENLLTVLSPLQETDPELWGGEIWETLQEANTRGDAAMAEKRWEEAEQAYQEALRDAQDLEGRLPEVPDQLYPEAFTAYSQGRAGESVRMLRAILQIEPDYAKASELLPRAERADTSFESFQEAGRLMEEGNVELAYAEISRLLEADGDFPGAAELSERIVGHLVENELQNLLGRALTALDAEDLETAEAAVRDAAALAPEHPDVAEVGSQVEAVKVERQILSLKEEADALTAQEEWKKAHSTWLTIRSLDPDAPWVIRGVADSLRWAVIDEKLRKGLAHPAGPQAAEWVKDFQEREGWPSGLQEKAEELESAWRAWTTPVKVILISDGETTVTVPRKGRWKELVRREIELLPGEYVAKGGRLGYRDVRVEFDVPPGEEQVEVTVICRERI